MCYSHHVSNSQSVFEQMSYDLDEEIEIAEELLGAKGFQEMVEDNSRRLEDLWESGGHILSSQK